MNGYCEEYDRFVDLGGLDGENAPQWREHLRGCPTCSKQLAAEASLRQAFAGSPPPPGLAAGFEARLHQRLDARRPDAARGHTGLGRLWPSWGWTLASYATAATFASILILSRLPWQSFEAPRGLVFALGALVLASPLVLLDRIGILRPPG
jgi:hypothetical protein